MDFLKDYDSFKIHAFWSKDITALIEKITALPAKTYATQHDMVLKFINKKLYEGKGVFNKEFRVKGRRYFDLKIPIDDSIENFETVELKVHSSRLKYLKRELKKREHIFSNNDYLFFCYLLQVGSKDKGKVIKDRDCIYYLVIIILSKEIKTTPLEELVDEIKMGTEDFTKKLAEKSRIDKENEELLGVENIIKVVDLERKVDILKTQLGEMKAEIGEKEREIGEKEKELDKTERKLEEERSLRKQKEKEIERLRSQLKE